MEDRLLKTRGALVDEMQSRTRSLKRQGKAVPEEWTSKLNTLAETTDPAEISSIRDWMQLELPPLEYETDVVTWDTFKSFAEELVKKTAERAMIFQVIAGKKNAAAPDLIKEILALRNEAASPAEAMTQLGKIRARVAAEFPELIAGE